MNKNLVTAFLGVFVIIVLVLSALLFLRAQKAIAPEFSTALPQKKNPTGNGPVKKTLEETTIDYWLHGKIVEIVSEDSDGLHVLFVFEGDPTATTVPFMIRWMDGWYRLFIYEKDFLQPYRVERPDGAGLRKAITEAASVELRVQFLRNRILREDGNIMNQIEAASRGEWTQLPTDELRVDSVGIIK